MNKLSLQFLTLVIVILGFGLAIHSTINYLLLKKEYEQQISDNLIQLAGFVSDSAKDAYITSDLDTLQDYSRQLGESPDVEKALFVDSNMRVLAGSKSITRHEINHPSDGDMEKIVNIDIQHEGILFGYLHIDYTTTRALSLVMREFTKHMFSYGLLTLILSISIFVLIKKKVLNPIDSLIDGTKRISKGNFETEILLNVGNELETLARSFNNMSKSLEESENIKSLAYSELKTLNKQLETANTEKSRFLANMSHEIRTPLTSIIGFAENLNNPNFDENEKSTAVDTVIRNSHHLQQVINDILDISKIEAGELEAHFEQCSLIDIVENVASLVKARAKSKGLSFEVSYDFPIPDHITTDPLRFRQILLNLCGNAIKFTEKGGITITCRYKEPHIIISILDTGIGMTDSQIDKVFELFSQADESTTRKYGGTGLGLPLSRRLAKLLNGQIQVNSTPDKGSIFSLVLDIDNSDRKQLLARLPSKSDTHSIQHSQALEKLFGRVLVVDDARDNQILISSILKQAGLQPDIAENGEIALEKIARQTYDIVIMDKQMPVMDGLTATRKLRSQGNNIPIIALTADAFVDDKQLCLQAGCNEYITKPINRDLLINTIKNYVEKENTTYPRRAS